ADGGGGGRPPWGRPPSLKLRSKSCGQEPMAAAAAAAEAFARVPLLAVVPGQGEEEELFLGGVGGSGSVPYGATGQQGAGEEWGNPVLAGSGRSNARGWGGAG
ncbi:unnamed protein product, partial [Discosporangium mesarthrocarpum]